MGIDHRWKGMRSGLMGSHQLDNASLTLAACEIIMRKDAQLSNDHIQSGLAQNRWPGRLEVVCQTPYVILDGAHNLMAARRLGRFLQNTLAGRRITMVTGILDDKPYAAILKDLVAPCSRLILTRSTIDRSLPPETLEAAAKPLISDIQIIADVGDAVRHAIATSRPEDAVCIAGSLYVVGEAKAALEKSGESLFQI
jgi:dihydrofolate synthase/folylpolyglutamate synthase